MNEKACSRCGEVRPLTYFNRCGESKDGRRYDCKVCQAEDRRRWKERTRPAYRELHEIPSVVTRWLEQRA